MTQDVATALALVKRQIADAARRADRDPADIALVAVSKTQPLAKLRTAVAAGQQDFGENYLQEALDKIRALAGESLRWHFIGPIQSNKTRDIAAHFDWVHSVDRFKIARRLSEQRPPACAPLNICLQVNISGEPSKAGVAPEQLAELAAQCAELANIRLRGLMAIPAPAQDFEQQRAPFARLRQLHERLNAEGHALDTLSMGMTDDLDAAIAEGASHVRVGTAIFGARD